MKNDMKDSHLYDDIIDMPHPTSKKHPRMSSYDRAAQFSPFAALTGHDEVINEASRLTDAKIELSEDVITKLNERLNYVAKHIDERPKVTITYFVPDEKKSGGSYMSCSGVIKKIKENERTIVMSNGTLIPINQVSNIDGDIFAKSAD